jgi:hypothetical protein
MTLRRNAQMRFDLVALEPPEEREKLKRPPAIAARPLPVGPRCFECLGVRDPVERPGPARWMCYRCAVEYCNAHALPPPKEPYRHKSYDVDHPSEAPRRQLELKPNLRSQTTLRAASR